MASSIQKDNKMKTIEILLGGKKGGTALVDEADYEKVSGYSWRLNSRGYVITNLPRNGAKTQKQVLLHHLVLGKPENGLVTDHINHDKTDNRKTNLRICTKSQNAHNQGLSRNNTSGYKGVAYETRTNKYRAYIWFNKKSIKLGSFASAEEASTAYARAAKRYFGEYCHIPS